MSHTDDEHNPSLERLAGEDCEATWWSQRTPGTTYWRCLVPARHLPGQVLPFRQEDLQLDADEKPYLPRQKGVAIWQFLGDEIRSKVAFGMRDFHGTKTLMELDDNYQLPAPYLRNLKGAPWKATIKEARDAGTLYSHEMHRLLTPMFDGIITSTEYLADAYYDLNPNVYVCPNSIDPVDWQFEKPEDDGVFRIVYYGSYSHSKDTPIVTKALKWAARQDNVEVWTQGWDPKDWTFNKVVPWTYNLPDARKELFRFDLGVAPLTVNKWSKSKSDVKGLEYAMAGVCPLMTDCLVYDSFRDCDSDLLLKDSEWEEAIRFYVKNPDVAREKAKKAKDWVLENRTIDKTIHTWKEAISG